MDRNLDERISSVIKSSFLYLKQYVPLVICEDGCDEKKGSEIVRDALNSLVVSQLEKELDNIILEFNHINKYEIELFERLKRKINLNGLPFEEDARFSYLMHIILTNGIKIERNVVAVVEHKKGLSKGKAMIQLLKYLMLEISLNSKVDLYIGLLVVGMNLNGKIISGGVIRGLIYAEKLDDKIKLDVSYSLPKLDLSKKAEVRETVFYIDKMKVQKIIERHMKENGKKRFDNIMCEYIKEICSSLRDHLNPRKFDNVMQYTRPLHFLKESFIRAY